MKPFRAIIALSVLAAACGLPAEKAPSERPPLTVRVEAVAHSQHTGSFEAGGSVRARATVVLSSRIVAPVTAVRVDVGSRVRAGQLLVVLDDRALRAEHAKAGATVAAAEQAVAAADAEQHGATAALSLAAVTHSRIALLRTRNSATVGELDEAVAGLREAEARAKGAEARTMEAARGLDAARAALRAASATASYGTVLAPFDAVVTARAVDPGSLAAPGVPLLTVENTRGYQLHLHVDTARTALIAPGLQVAVSIEGPPQLNLEGTVVEVGRAFDPVTHTALVKIDLPGAEGLQTGRFARARLPAAARQSISVPARSVLTRGQLAMVFVADRDTARMRLVRVGPRTGERVEILAGLNEGDRVVLDPPADLADGIPVRGTVAADTGVRP